jgi:Uncharacterized membrane protein
MATNTSDAAKKNILDLFIEGARRGFTIGTTSLLPNVIMAFVIIRVLDVTGLLKTIGIVFSPVMALWGLPGEAATVLITAIMSSGGRHRRCSQSIQCRHSGFCTADNTDSSHLPDRQPRTEYWPLPWHFECEHKALCSDYRHMLHQCTAFHLGHAFYSALHVSQHLLSF